MELGISLYPEFMEEGSLRAYVERAASLGYSRVFLSLILSRLNFSGALPPDSEIFDRTFAACRDHGMKITVDVDSEMLEGLGETEEAVACLRRRGVDCLRIGEMPTRVAGLVNYVKAYEQLAVRAAVEKDYDIALSAMMANPFIDDYEVGKAILDELIEQHTPYLDYLKK